MAPPVRSIVKTASPNTARGSRVPGTCGGTHVVYVGLSEVGNRAAVEERIVSDFLDEKRQEITDRLKELKPVVDEVRRLEAAVAALAGTVGSAASGASASAVAAVTGRRGRGRPRGTASRARKATPASASAVASTPATVERKKPGRPKGSGKKVGRPPGSGTKAAASPAKRRAGHRKGGGKRATEALSLVQGQPGITIPELAAKMGIKQNYLYRLLPGLEQEGKLEKKGRGWHPKA